MNKPEWKFLLNGIEINLDLFNYNEIALKISRNKEYWGYTREASLESLEFIKKDAQVMKGLFNSEGVQIDATFEIQRLNEEAGLYEVWQSGVIDIMDYKEFYNSNNNLEKVEVNIVDSSIQQKLKTRQNNNVKIGNATSIEGVAVTALSPIQVSYLSRPLIYEVFSEISGNFSGVPNLSNPLNPFNEMNFAALQMESSVNNIPFFQNSVYQGDIDITNINNDPPVFGFNALPFFSLILEESNKDFPFTCNFDIDVEIQDISFGPSVTFNNLRLRVYGANYDGVVFTNVSSVYVNTFSITVSGGLGVINITDTFTFTKESNKVYFITLDANGQNWGLEYSGGCQGTFNMSYLDEVDVSSHKSFLIFEVFNSVLEQITDTPNVLESNLLGRTDIGYPDDGDFSQISLTSGLFLRNAINMDSTEVVMETNFKDLYDTLTALIGVAMWFENGKIKIEKRSEAFGSNIVELNPTNLERSIFTDLIYSKIVVGNRNIKYENVNGQNEHNTILEFSTPLRVKENTLNLVTKHQTDYLGVELARRLSISTDANVDTKYDDKIFWVVVKPTFLQYVSVIGFDGYDVITGIILPDYAGNLLFSPKRMLFRNEDLLTTGFFKNIGLSIKFEKCDTLARLESEETGDLPIRENEDYLLTENFADFNPMMWDMEIGEKDIWQVMKNQNNLFKFELNCGSVYGYLWDLTLKGNKGTLKLIEANYPKEE